MKTRTTNVHHEALCWENVAATRRYVRHTSEIEKKAIIKTLSLAIKPTTALEIGCEGGRWSKLLSDAGWKLICMDTNRQALNICQERIPSATCILVNADDLELHCDTESVGLILCIEVPEVINASWFTNEVFRVLQKRGLIVGVFFNRLSWRGLLHPFTAFLKGGLPYVYRYSYPNWRKSWHEKGFSLTYEEGFGWSPLSKTSDSPLVPVVTRIEHYLGLRRIISLSPLIAFIAQKD